VLPCSSDRVVHNIMRELIGNTAPADDVALLVLHKTNVNDAEDDRAGSSPRTTNGRSAPARPRRATGGG